MRRSAQRSVGGMTIVVTTAIATIIVNSSVVIAPIDNPIVATMTSVDPRAFMPQPSARAARADIPLENAPTKAPANLPTLAIAISASVMPSNSGCRRIDRSLWRPARPKKIGMNTACVKPRS